MLKGVASITPALITYTFATLPAVATATLGQRYFVSDVGKSGSWWISNGTSWVPLNGNVTMVTSAYPFILPTSGSVAVTTGVITLSTALDNIYSNAYMYFPANTFTGSTAGFYYVTMSSTTVGLMYSTKYTSGLPVTPTSPSLITTGAGAYTQTTGSVAGQSFSILGGLMDLTGILYAEFNCSCKSSPDVKTLSISYDGSSTGTSTVTNTTFLNQRSQIENKNVTGAQICFQISDSGSGSSFTELTIDSTLTKSIIYNYQIATASNWIVCRCLSLALKI